MFWLYADNILLVESTLKDYSFKCHWLKYLIYMIFRKVNAFLHNPNFLNPINSTFFKCSFDIIFDFIQWSRFFKKNKSNNLYLCDEIIAVGTLWQELFFIVLFTKQDVVFGVNRDRLQIHIASITHKAAKGNIY